MLISWDQFVSIPLWAEWDSIKLTEQQFEYQEYGGLHATYLQILDYIDQCDDYSFHTPKAYIDSFCSISLNSKYTLGKMLYA